MTDDLKERLARALWKPWHDADFPEMSLANDDDWENASGRVKEDYLGLIDAIETEWKAQGYTLSKRVHTAASSVLHDSKRSKSAKVAAGLSLTQRSKRR